MEKISSIKELLSSTEDNELLDFISKYSEDERGGVKRLIASAQKRFLKYERELLRTEEMRSFERKYSDYKYICGVDEVGRGPLSGPVMAGAVILPADCDILYLNDSKKLTEKKRNELYDIIKQRAVSWSVFEVSHERIDEINILNATYEAMRGAISSLSVRPDLLLVDAVHIPGVDYIKQVSIVKGDAKSISIAAASIMAKVTRDRLMEEMDAKYPGYGFASNKGYGSKAHMDAIKEIGPCEIHRRSFIKGILS